jgi:tyrosyl-tRNA synthetase
MSPLPQLTQEELDALFAQQMYDEEKREQRERLAEDERIVKELVEREKAQHEKEQTEADEKARRLEEQLFDADLRQENGVLECEVCYGEFYRGELLPSKGERPRSARSALMAERFVDLRSSLL